MKVLLFFLFLSAGISLSQSCSCMYTKPAQRFCELENVIKVEVVEVLIDRPTGGYGYDRRTEPPITDNNNSTSSNSSNSSSTSSQNTTDTGPTTTQPQTTSRLFIGKKEVVAIVIESYRGSFESHERVILTSPVMGSMCGIGSAIQLGETYILDGSMYDGKIHVGLCDFFFNANTRPDIEAMVRANDCSCNKKRCRLDLANGNSLKRKVCRYSGAYCSRDEDGECVWQGVSNFKCCRKDYDVCKKMK